MLMTKTKIVKYFEIILAVVVLLATVYYFVESAIYLLSLDWSITKTFYEFINRILLISVGVEFSRLLITHDTHAVTDLLVFAVARKLLQPDISTNQLILYVIAFCLLALTDALVDKIRAGTGKE
jgi:hypothetical protein